MIPAGMQTTGARVMVISAPHYTEQGEPHFIWERNISDRGIAVGEADPLGDIPVYFPDDPGVTELSRTCLMVILPPPQIEANDLITQEMAAHVLHEFGGGLGYPPGDFIRQLITLMAKADPGNRMRLAVAYPGYARAVTLAQMELNGMEVLQRLLRFGGEE